MEVGTRDLPGQSLYLLCSVDSSTHTRLVLRLCSSAANPRRLGVRQLGGIDIELNGIVHCLSSALEMDALDARGLVSFLNVFTFALSTKFRGGLLVIHGSRW